MKSAPGVSEIHARVMQHIAAREFEQARRACEKLCRKADNADSWALLAAIHGRLGDVDSAEKCCRRALKLNPDHPGANQNLGMVLNRRGDLAAAAACFRRTLACQPGNSDVHCMLGNVSKGMKDLEPAAASYRRCIELDPRNAAAYCGLGAVLTGLGQSDAAKEALEKALQLDPGSEAARYYLAFLNAPSHSEREMSESVARFFDDFAGRFDQHLVEVLNYRFPEQVKELVQRVFGAQQLALDILDAGCGTGLCGVALKDLAASLTGVDLSAAMIEKAKARDVYDRLVVGDLLDPRVISPLAYDLIVAGDVFVYVGDLAEVFAAFSRSLRQGGVLMFTTESAEGDSFALQETGRYAHSLQYIRNLAARNGLMEKVVDDIVIRTQYFKPIPGHAIALGKK